MNRRAITTAALLGCLVLAGDLSAHDTWLLPQSMRVHVGQSVVLSLTSGEAFPADDFAVEPARVVRASVRLAGRTTSLASPRAAPQALRYFWTPRASGVAGLAVELAPRTLTLTPDKIEEYFAEINASGSVRAAWDSVPKPRQWRERYTKHAASWIRVGDPVNDTSWRAPLGMGLEIMPEVDPTSLRAGRELLVRVARDGRPVGRVQVGLQHEGDPHASFTTTDGGGRARLKMPRAGRWLVNVTDLRRTHAPDLEWESDFATLTIAVAARSR